jgi:hypothetical protein
MYDTCILYSHYFQVIVYIRHLYCPLTFHTSSSLKQLNHFKGNFAGMLLVLSFTTFFFNEKSKIKLTIHVGWFTIGKIYM